MQKYVNVPACVKVWLYMVPALDAPAVAQFMSLGEQNLLSATPVLGSPLVTV
jgi:hypothetical protein